jgi:hypothetical protein
MLWPLIFAEHNFLHFAHTSFLWSNLASNKAAVTCVILGLSTKPTGNRRLFANDVVRQTDNISPYLVATESVIVTKRTSPLSDIESMQSGNKPTDGGYLIYQRKRKRESWLLTHMQPGSALRRLKGANQWRR